MECLHAKDTMYVRFVTPLVDPRTGSETGFFRASWYLRRIGCPDWIHEELDHQFSWFNRHLPVPGATGRWFNRRNPIFGVCWFRDGARECIERARYCAWLISEGGLPVDAVKVPGFREIIWRDDHQVVARQTQDLPRAFTGQRFVPAQGHWN